MTHVYVCTHENATVKHFLYDNPKLITVKNTRLL